MEKKTERTIYVPFVKMTMVKEKEFPYEREEIGSPEKVAAFCGAQRPLMRFRVATLRSKTATRLVLIIAD